MQCLISAIFAVFSIVFQLYEKKKKTKTVSKKKLYNSISTPLLSLTKQKNPQLKIKTTILYWIIHSFVYLILLL